MTKYFKLEEIVRAPQPAPARTLADVPIGGTCLVDGHLMTCRRAVRNDDYCVFDHSSNCNKGKCPTIGASHILHHTHYCVDIRNPDGTPLDQPANPKPWTLGECDNGDVVLFKDKLQTVSLRDIVHRKLHPLDGSDWNYWELGLSVTARYRLVPVEEPVGMTVNPEEWHMLQRNLAEAYAETSSVKVALAASEGLVREIQHQASLQADRIRKLQLDAQTDSAIKQGMNTAAANADTKIDKLEARIRELENVPFRFEPCEPNIKTFGDINVWDYGYRNGYGVLAGHSKVHNRTMIFDDGSAAYRDAPIFPNMTVVGRLAWNQDYQPPKIDQPESPSEK